MSPNETDERKKTRSGINITISLLFFNDTYIFKESSDLRAIPEEGYDVDVVNDDVNPGEKRDIFPVKRVNFDSSEYPIQNCSPSDSSSGNDSIEAFKETEAIPEKKSEPAKYRRSSTRPAPGSVKKLMIKFQNP